MLQASAEVKMLGFIRNAIKEKLLILQGYTKQEAKQETSNDKNAPGPGPSA